MQSSLWPTAVANCVLRIDKGRSGLAWGVGWSKGLLGRSPRFTRLGWGATEGPGEELIGGEHLGGRAAPGAEWTGSEPGRTGWGPDLGMCLWSHLGRGQAVGINRVSLGGGHECVST